MYNSSSLTKIARNYRLRVQVGIGNYCCIRFPGQNDKMCPEIHVGDKTLPLSEVPLIKKYFDDALIKVLKMGKYTKQLVDLIDLKEQKKRKQHNSWYLLNDLYPPIQHFLTQSNNFSPFSTFVKKVWLKVPTGGKLIKESLVLSHVFTCYSVQKVSFDGNHRGLSCKCEGNQCNFKNHEGKFETMTYEYNWHYPSVVYHIWSKKGEELSRIEKHCKEFKKYNIGYRPEKSEHQEVNNFDKSRLTGSLHYLTDFNKFNWYRTKLHPSREEGFLVLEEGGNILHLSVKPNNFFWENEREKNEVCISLRRRSIIFPENIIAFYLSYSLWIIILQTPDDELLLFDLKNYFEKLEKKENVEGLKAYSLTFEKHITAIAYDKKLLAVAIDKNINIYRIENASTIQYKCTLVGHQDEINDLAFKEFGSKLISGADDGTARVWDLRNLE